jgi:hypothetical protein
VVTAQGPIVDVAVPTLQTIFSDGSDSSKTPQGRLNQPINIINLGRTDKAICDVLKQCQNIQDTLFQKVDAIAQQIGKDVADIQKLIGHQKVHITQHPSQVGSVSPGKYNYILENDLITYDLVYRKFLDNKQDVLKNIISSSGPGAFDQIF